MKFTFRHGVHPPDAKELTASLPLRRMPFPDELVVPLKQHAGKPARRVVEVGQHVQRGDLLAETNGWLSSPVHASAAGVVKEVDLFPHPDGAMSEAILIAVDPYSPQIPRRRTLPPWETLEPDEIIELVWLAGVVGLGGAAFPTHVKLVLPEGARVHTLIVNGAECEPYLTSDHRTMVEYPDRVLLGVRIMLKTLSVPRAVIGVEKNKPDAIAALRRALGNATDISVLPLTVKYPQGAEKMLIKAITGQEVPSGKLPVHAGVLVQNVGSAACIAEVFETGMPLVERIVTVSGHGVATPANLIVPVGTRIRDVLAFCGGLTDDAEQVVFGGPMMGVVQPNLDAPVVKGTTGILALTAAEIVDKPAQPCIHCGRCLDACPVFLNPERMAALAQLGRFEEMKAMHLADCMLCGSCAYACPSGLPLAQMFALSKSTLRRRKGAAA